MSQGFIDQICLKALKTFNVFESVKRRIAREENDGNINLQNEFPLFFIFSLHQFRRDS